MIAVLCIMLGICVIHECLHIYVAESMDIETSVSWRTKKGIPYALAVDMDGYKTSYRLLPEYKKRRYNKIAVAPYLYVVPFAVFLFITGDSLLMLTSIAIQATHLVNYPLEWVVQ